MKLQHNKPLMGTYEAELELIPEGEEDASYKELWQSELHGF